jgi:hypothetical protein
MTDDACDEPILLGKLQSNKWLFYEPKYENIFWKIVKETKGNSLKRQLHNELSKQEKDKVRVSRLSNLFKKKIQYFVLRKHRDMYQYVSALGLFFYLKVLGLVGVLSLSGFLIQKAETKQCYVTDNHVEKPCETMDRCLKYYSHYYNIPEHVLFGVAFYETGYNGLNHTNYNHLQRSSVGALGPMQIMLKTARSINNDTVSIYKLQSDIDYNVSTSAKLLRYLHNSYGSWDVALGYYNTGYPIVNEYAQKICAFKKMD